MERVTNPFLLKHYSVRDYAKQNISVQDTGTEPVEGNVIFYFQDRSLILQKIMKILRSAQDDS